MSFHSTMSSLWLDFSLFLLLLEIGTPLDKDKAQISK